MDRIGIFKVSVWASDGLSVVSREGPLDPGQIVDLQPGSYRYWSADDIASFKAMRRAGKKYIEIAVLLGRTYNSVRNKGQGLAAARRRLQA